MNKSSILLVIILLITGFEVWSQSYDKTFVFLYSKPDKTELSESEVATLMTKHLANIDRLAKEGKILVAGPFDGGGGIFILSTGSLSEAQTWLSTDPAVKADRWNIEMYPFSVSQGKLCTPVEPYEMVTYNFVRFSPHNQIANYKMSGANESEPTTIDVVQQLQLNNALLIEADFANEDGGIFIYKGEDQSDLINKDSSVQNGEMDVFFKTIWLAKGGFCEN